MRNRMVVGSVLEDELAPRRERLRQLEHEARELRLGLMDAALVGGEVGRPPLPEKVTPRHGRAVLGSYGEGSLDDFEVRD